MNTLILDSVLLLICTFCLTGIDSSANLNNYFGDKERFHDDGSSSPNDFVQLCETKSGRFPFDFHYTRRHDSLKKLAKEIYLNKEHDKLKLLLLEEKLKLFINSDTFEFTWEPAQWTTIHRFNFKKENESFKNYLIEAAIDEYWRKLLSGETEALDPFLEKHFNLWLVYVRYVDEWPDWKMRQKYKMVKRFSKPNSWLKVKSIRDFLVWRQLVYFPYRADNPGIMLRLIRLDPRESKAFTRTSFKYNLPLLISALNTQIFRMYALLYLASFFERSIDYIKLFDYPLLAALSFETLFFLAKLYDSAEQMTFSAHLSLLCMLLFFSRLITFFV